jgi:predicted DNA binding CopG/RHH family protein
MYQPKRSKLRKDNVVGLRISEEEYDRIKNSAMLTGLTMSSWCREIILDYLRMQEEFTENSGE